jgi:hypothetical protein
MDTNRSLESIVHFYSDTRDTHLHIVRFYSEEETFLNLCLFALCLGRPQFELPPNMLVLTY